MYHRFNWTKVSHRRNWISREYEPLQPYFFLALAQAAGAKAFVDVGSNIGLYSVFMSQAVPRITAYEANDALARQIEENFALNGISGTVRRVAVSDRAGTVSFGIVSRYAGNSAVVAEGADAASFADQTEVEAVTLDDELSGEEGPIALKIDVEGHERAVLDGARHVLTNRPCILQIENFEDAVDTALSGMSYRKLTSIGPDAYFTNIDTLDPLAIFETASAAMIAANHEDKSMILRRGDIGLVISGRLYTFARGVARRVLGGKL